MFFTKNFLKKYKQKLQKNKLLEKKVLQHEKDKFICILQHDIKTPILAHNQTLELLLQGKFGSLNNSQIEIIKEIYISNNFLLETVANSIFLSKYESAVYDLNLENINIIEQTKDCLNLIRVFAQEKQQNIVIETNQKEDIKLNADRKLIQKLIYNLLTSCISSARENSLIEIIINEDKDSVSFRAKNKSVYMTKEKINSLFEEKKNLRDFNQLGMNLNLNIVKKLVEAHKWSIIAESSKDNSSSFGFLVKKN